MSGNNKKSNLHSKLNLMDTNSNNDFKRPKRPRIGSKPEGGETSNSRFEKVSYGRQNNGALRNFDGNGEDGVRRPYQSRPRFNNMNNGGEGGYQSRPRYNNYNQNNNGGEGGYQPRPRYNNYNQNNNGGEGGYQPRPRYNNYNQNNNGGEGGYQPRPRYNNNYNQNQNGEGEWNYQPRPRYNGGNNAGGNYQNNRQGGYQRNNNAGGNNRYGGQKSARQMQRPGKSFTPRPKRIEYEQPEVDPNEEVRLNKFIANAGICSRREADELITNGSIKVNGQVVTELGTKITAKDIVEYNEKVVTTEKKCYVLLNKPKDTVTTVDDPNGRKTVMDIVQGACEERIYPVGRLDRNTTGVLLLTNDGDLASKLTHPQYVKKKIYHVWTDRDIAEEDMQRIADGIELEDGPIHADAISYATETDRNQAGIEIHSGRNRIVRRIFESLGYHVTKLDRVYFAGLTKKNLPRGRWRYLTQEEVNFLKMGSFE